jgi:hypothetical protein
MTARQAKISALEIAANHLLSLAVGASNTKVTDALKKLAAELKRRENSLADTEKRESKRKKARA